MVWEFVAFDMIVHFHSITGVLPNFTKTEIVKLCSMNFKLLNDSVAEYNQWVVMQRNGKLNQSPKISISEKQFK